jgi:hypothetical protein
MICSDFFERIMHKCQRAGSPSADHFGVASDEGASRAVQATKPSGFDCGLIPRKSWLETAQAVTLLQAILNFHLFFGNEWRRCVRPRCRRY